jgi:hypothetical protein
MIIIIILINKDKKMIPVVGGAAFRMDHDFENIDIIVEGAESLLTGVDN